MKLTIEGDGKGPVSHVHLPLVLPVTPRPHRDPLHPLFVYLFFNLVNPYFSVFERFAVV